MNSNAIQIARKAFNNSGLSKSYDCYFDEETGMLVIHGKKKEKEKENKEGINNRFEILDL